MTTNNTAENELDAAIAASVREHRLTRQTVMRLYLAAEEWLHNDGVNVSISREPEDEVNNFDLVRHEAG